MGRREARGAGRGAKAGAPHLEAHVSFKHRAERCSPRQGERWRRVRASPEALATPALPFCTALPAVITLKGSVFVLTFFKMRIHMHI